MFIKNDRCWFATFEFPPAKKGRVSTQSAKSGKVREFFRRSGKSQGRKFLSMQSFNFNEKNHLHTEMCVVELYMTISSIYDAIICIWF